MSRFWKIALTVVLVVIVLAVGFRLLHKPGARGHQQPGGQGVGADATGKDTAPVPVTVEPVARQNVPVYLVTQGTVQALNTVTVNPQVGGQLLSLNFTEGKEVKKGEVLAQIDPRTFQATYDQAMAKKRQDQASLSTARNNYARSNDPKYVQYVAKQDLDNLRNTADQAQALISADDAAIRDAQVNLGYTKVLSPIDGIAGIRGVDPGNVVTTTSSIVTLTQVHPINVIFTLAEQNLDTVRSANAANPSGLQVAALDRTDAHPIASGGVLKVIDNQIDPSSGTFKLKAEFPNAKGELWPGQFVNVQLLVTTVGGGLVVPTQAVQRGPDGDYVYVVQADKTVKMQPVTTANEVGDSHIMIAKGLAAGASVVTEGQFRLKPGSKVNPLKPGEVPPAPTAEEMDKAKKDASGHGRRGGQRGG